MKPSFTLGIEEEYQTIDPGHVRSALAHQHRDHREGQAAAEREGQGRDAPVGGRGRHRRLPQRSRKRAPTSSTCGAQMIALAEENGLLLVRRRHASVRRLARAGHLSRRALPAGRRGHADWSRASNLIFGLHVHVGIEDRETSDSPDEPDAVLPAAPARALDQLAVLARHEHRPEVVPLQGVRQVPAHQHSRHLHELGRLRELRQPAGHAPTASTTPRRSGGTSGRIRSSRRSKSASATCRCASTRRWRSPR